MGGGGGWPEVLPNESVLSESNVMRLGKQKYMKPPMDTVGDPGEVIGDPRVFGRSP